MTDYEAIAHAYRESKRLPIKQYSEEFTFFQLLGSLRDLAILEVACGEGYYTQAMKRQGAAQYYLLLACYISGDYRGTEDRCRQLMQSLQGERSRERFSLAVFPAVLSRALLARALAERGVFDEGDVHGHEAIRIAEALEHPYSIVWACLGLAHLDSLKGELSQAARLLERAVGLCREWTITIWIPLTTASLGHVYAWSGRLEEGMSWLQQGLAALIDGQRTLPLAQRRAARRGVPARKPGRGRPCLRRPCREARPRTRRTRP